MIECPHCHSFEEMIDDSSLKEGTYEIFLECPSCGWRFVKDVPIEEFEQLPPLGL